MVFLLKKHAPLPLLAFVAVLLCAGCGRRDNTPPTADVMRERNLMEVGELLRVYQAEKSKPPTSLAELQVLPAVEMIASMGLEMLKNGEIVTRWEAKLPDTGEEPGTTPDQEVLAYYREVPEQGGLVLLLNRNVQTMTAEEFQAAPKAGKEPAPTPEKGS